MKNSKKHYIYFAAPIVGLIIFLAFYLNFRSSYEQEKADKAAAEQAEKNAQIEKQNAERAQAVKDAQAASEKRKQERAEKEAEREKRNDERQQAFQARDKAQIDAAKFKDLAEKRRKEVATVKEEIAKIEQDEKVLQGEKAFLDDYTVKVTANVSNLTQVLEKIKRANDAAAAAAAAAAKAAAKKTS